MARSLLENPNFSWFGWNPTEWDEAAEDTVDTLPATGDITQAIGGGEATNAMGVDLNRIRFPTTGSFDRTDIPNVTDTGEKFSDLPITDPRYMSEAEQIFQQNRADAGAYAWDSPQYIGGAAGNITQTGPGRQFIYDDTGDEYDDIHLYGGPEEDASWFKRLREGAMDNPLMQGVMSAVSPAMTVLKGLKDAFPVNERAIKEQQLSQQGFAIDDIGRIAFQDFGTKADGTFGALGAYDPSGINIMAGYNANLITQDTFDKRRKKARDKMSDKGFKEFDIALTAAEEIWKKTDEDTEEIVGRREYKKREKKREKIQKDLAAAGFGESGAVGIDKDMDVSIQDYDDAGTYIPPKDNIQATKDAIARARYREQAEKSPGYPGNQVTPAAPSTPSYSHPSAGVGAQASIDTSGKFAGKGTGNPWGRAKGGLIRKKYGDGGIVDLL